MQASRVFIISDTRADALLIGCLIAFVMAHHTISRQKVFRQNSSGTGDSISDLYGGLRRLDLLTLIPWLDVYAD